MSIFKINWELEWIKEENEYKKTNKIEERELTFKEKSAVLTNILTLYSNANGFRWRKISKIGLFFMGHPNRTHVDAVIDNVAPTLFKGTFMAVNRLQNLYVNLVNADKPIKRDGDFGRILHVFRDQGFLTDIELNAFFQIGYEATPRKHPIASREEDGTIASDQRVPELIHKILLK